VFKEGRELHIPVRPIPKSSSSTSKASRLLARVVGSRGGIKIGGMAAACCRWTLGTDGRVFQVTIKGFIKDVITQMKRDLSGAFGWHHPFRYALGVALVERLEAAGRTMSPQNSKLITSLLDQKNHKEILAFVNGPDIKASAPATRSSARALL